MAGNSTKKRSYGPEGKVPRPSKKQRQAASAAYHSSSEEDESEDDYAHGDDKGVPLPEGLFDSEEDLENMVADDGQSSGEEGSGSENSQSESARKSSRKQPSKKPKAKVTRARDAPLSSDEDKSEQDATREKSTKKEESSKPANKKRQQQQQNPLDDSDASMDSQSESNSGSDDDGEDDPFRTGANRVSTRSKRNDPEAFATSMTKMLSSKLPASKRADPIVARSAESAAAARQVVDGALEAKARKRLREQKRLALEKGRVRDVLMPSTTKTLDFVTGEIREEVADGAESTGEILATERRLKKVAQRGVVKLFNAVRAAQVKATEAQRTARQEGIVGVKRREEKVTEMSRQGFLDLIASGGGGLKKGGLEEA